MANQFVVSLNLLSWDRAGVAMVKHRNGLDTAYVALAGEDKVNVVKFSEVGPRAQN